MIADTASGLCYQLHPIKAKEWTDRNLVKFNKGKCKVLQLQRNNPRHQYVLGPTQMESRFAEKNLGVFADTRLIMSQQCALVVLGEMLPAGSEGWSFLATQHWWDHTWGTVTSSGLTDMRHMDVLETACEKAMKVVKGLEHLSCGERLMKGTVQPGEEEAWQDLFNISIKTWREGANRMEPGAFQWRPVTGPEAKQNAGTSRNIVHCVVKRWHRLPGNTLESPSLAIFRSHLDIV